MVDRFCYDSVVSSFWLQFHQHETLRHRTTEARRTALRCEAPHRSTDRHCQPRFLAPQHGATRSNMEQHGATRSNTKQHAATRTNATAIQQAMDRRVAPRRSTLDHDTHHGVDAPIQSGTFSHRFLTDALLQSCQSTHVWSICATPVQIRPAVCSE